MKTKSLILILGVCLMLIASIPVKAQCYAKVTVYTNTRQDISGTFRFIQVTGEDPGHCDWMGSFNFGWNEGGATDRGYIYQKWFLLDGMSGSPLGTSFRLDTYCNGASQSSDVYAAGYWPQFLVVRSFDFRTQGEE